MEQKQNVKPTTIEDQIEALWKANSHIPFMQSKEILKFGYLEGRKSIGEKAQAAVQAMAEAVADESFTGTTKEFLEHVEKETTRRRFGSKDENNKTVYIQASALQIEEEKFKLLDELLNFVTDKRDLMETYTKIKDMRLASQKQLKALRNKYDRKK